MLDLSLFSILNIFLFLDTSPSGESPLLVSLVLSSLVVLILLLFTFGVFRVLAREPL